MAEEVKKRHRRTKAEMEAYRASLEAEKLEKQKAKAEDKEEKKPKGNDQELVVPERGSWSEPTKSISMGKLFVEIELLEPALGTTPGSKKLMEDYIASKSPDAISRTEQIEQYGEEAIIERQTTIFPKGRFRLSENGQHWIDVLDKSDGGDRKVVDSDVKMPFFWNYQIRGFCKDSCGLLQRADYGRSAKTKAYKKVIDGGIFVFPRRIAIELPKTYIDEYGCEKECDVNDLYINQRSIRINGRMGEVTAIAASEQIPAGSRMKVCFGFTDPKNRDAIIEWLNYGSIHGFGAWRNSGLGIFRWREINEDWGPIISE